MLSLGLSDPFLQSVRIVAPNSLLMSVRSIHWWEGTSNFFGSAVGLWMVPMSQLYVAKRFEAVSGNVAFRLDSLVFQSITFPISTRLPASPAESRIVWRNPEPAVSRETSSATRTGPFSTTRIFAGPLT